MTPWTVAYQAPMSMGFSRQEYWSGLPFPSPGDLPDPGIEAGSPALEADTSLIFLVVKMVQQFGKPFSGGTKMGNYFKENWHDVCNLLS